jgi:predicted Zn-ribbon and HTH transcriptional regulator
VSRGPAQAGRARFDIGEIVRAHRAQLETKHPLTREQKRVLTDIGQCRTAALGGHVDHCPSCGYEHPSYNSCRNRHCPKCQALAQEKWIEQRSARLLDVGHFHLVFTLPSELRFLAKLAPWEVFDALFHAVVDTLIELGETRLKARLGATLVLHTWTRDLRFHPHIHAIVTGGGLALDGSCFRRSARKYLFPVKAMGKLLRGKLLASLSKAYAASAFAHVDAFRDPRAFPALVARVAKLSWNVYAKAPFATTKHVVAYLGRYTHRVGIANSRLVDVASDRIVFATKNGQTATLGPVEFLARFVQHVLPDGFHKIRHIGLYASASKRALAEALLGSKPPPAPPKRTMEQRLLELTGVDVRRCPRCLSELVPIPLPDARAPPPPARELAA